ncbi:MAG: ATP-dependent protease ATPase subunit HslU [Clostridia bacterium]|nr:ATP-dependent protease ATPase subunit HslU [Clostridia bacterium]
MLTPRETVAELDKYIVGQDNAKRAVAIALRNRYRRLCVADGMRDEIFPNNIIMMGPTGVGKTEIARRLAKIAEAPFVKVEATKFTEVGYVGRDVDSMIRDLVEASVKMTTELKKKEVYEAACEDADRKIIKLLQNSEEEEPFLTPEITSLTELIERFRQEEGKSRELVSSDGEEIIRDAAEREKRIDEHLRKIEADYRAGLLEDKIVELVTEKSQLPGGDTVMAVGLDIDAGGLFGSLLPKQRRKMQVTVKEARKILIDEYSENAASSEDTISAAIELAEEKGIVFIDEIDKIAGKSNANDHDVSREGVQRDILPVVEGCSVKTKYGFVKTHHILFIAAGAFHLSKVSDLIPELQGRFPIRVELSSLTEEDYKLILTQPQNAVIKQYTALLAADNVFIDFDDEAISLIAKYAAEFNDSCEDIGARRLHSVLEKLLDDVLFCAGENADKPLNLHITGEYVKEHVSGDFGAMQPDKYIV